MSEPSYKGSCFCGAVELSATGEPAGMGYCHCSSCRAWAAAPVNAFTLWKPEAIRVTKGADNLGSFRKSENSLRKWCKTCGGHVLTEHPVFGLVDVYAAVFRDLPFRAGIHVNYAETVLRMHDGLPKMKDFPKELGGTNTLVAE